MVALLLPGGASSNDGDVTGNRGGDDYWLLKLDSVGNITWEKHLVEAVGMLPEIFSKPVKEGIL